MDSVWYVYKQFKMMFNCFEYSDEDCEMNICNQEFLDYNSYISSFTNKEDYSTRSIHVKMREALDTCE